MVTMDNMDFGEYFQQVNGDEHSVSQKVKFKLKDVES